MKYYFFIIITFTLCCCQPNESFKKLIDNRLKCSVEQYGIMVETIKYLPALLPRSIDSNGKVVATKYSDWVSGYFPGALWYLYEYSQDEQMLKKAREYTALVENAKYDRSKHDIGLMLYCSFGNGYRITGDTVYRNILLAGAESLANRFNPKTGCIQSWNEMKKQAWQYPVIIDGMACLELLLWASKETGDTRFRDICISHADMTMKNHFRPDYSSYHVVSYDPASGSVEKKNTHQGYADESAWARGQAWGLYGYILMYRETREPRYLEQAQNIASFILNHPNLPSDKIPYWDFNAPDIPDALRDASAAAMIASALVELSYYVDPVLAQKYLNVAETQLRTLSSPEYFAVKGTNGNFILKHAVGHMPNNSEIDVPIIYADYYYIEALMRFRKLF